MTTCEFCGPFGGIGCPMCAEGLTGAVTAPEDIVQDTALTAWKEQGDVLAVVYCAKCPSKGHKRALLGSARRSSRGLVYDANLPGSVDMGPDWEEIEESQKRSARSADVRLPFLGAVGGCAVLLDVSGQDPPAAECPRHGIEVIAPEVLVKASLDAKLGDPTRPWASTPIIPGQVLIHLQG